MTTIKVADKEVGLTFGYVGAMDNAHALTSPETIGQVVDQINVHGGNVYVIDEVEGEVVVTIGAENFSMFNLGIEEQPTVEGLIRDLADTCFKRQDVLINSGSMNYVEHNVNNEVQLPPVMLMVTDSVKLAESMPREQFKNVVGDLDIVVRLGRTIGVHCVLNNAGKVFPGTILDGLV